ncbi:sulfite exporter TauE/SafE family protein [Eudoraea chungangensis]|uniref:sulfite exporter TauE/SafE family protein n=1 Tax=Eudoraea chungangensis TaxID=1481905 RepID=UPI0023EB24BF|nr:sulfite exporter TauE/SafE family protein [Eudoraea chungangensis]
MALSALILGLMGSLHCIGMCGPIAFMLPVNRKSNYKKALQVSIYHFGRLLAYGTIGMVFGFIGKGLYIFGIQQKLSILIGIIMIALVLIPFVKLSSLSISKPIYRIISTLKDKLGFALKRKSNDAFLTIGFFNGFLPCGLVYMALLGAMAMANPIQGSFYMVLFGLGTVPLMTMAVYFSSAIKQTTMRKVKKLIPVFIVIIGILFILRGLGLGIPYVSPQAAKEVVSTELECH